MYRCRLYLGTIETRSSGAAIRIHPPGAYLPAQMSVVSFAALLGHDQTGTGLAIDGGWTYRIDGSRISGFDVGVYVGEAGGGKIDTIWFWIASIRGCNTGIWERQQGVDDHIWNVRVDPNLPGSIGVRMAALYDRWNLFIGDGPPGGTSRPIVLDLGATHNVFEVRPVLPDGAIEDHSGNDSNVILMATRPPYRAQ